MPEIRFKEQTAPQLAKPKSGSAAAALLYDEISAKTAFALGDRFARIQIELEQAHELLQAEAVSEEHKRELWTCLVAGLAERAKP